MIIRTRRKRESLIRRIFRRTRTAAPGSQLVLDHFQFRIELVKEIYRSDRRGLDREFGLIRMVFPSRIVEQQLQLDSSLITRFRSRLRITDSIGWYDSSLAFLLPETDKEGALDVANELAEIALREKLNVNTEISIYPWDDELIALSVELRGISNSENERRQGPNFPDPPSRSQSDSSNGESPNGAPSADATPNGASTNQTAPPSKQAIGRISQTSHSFVRSTPTPWWKRAIDIVGASSGLIILSPVFLFAAIVIKLSSPGPVLYLQKREGKDGRQFSILKFRTMVVGAEEQKQDLLTKNEQDGPAFKIEDDPRITGVGRHLRKSCVDELPQLINVLLGQMSLVGPRPLPVNESFACTAWQRARLIVLPGLTCTWQIRGRSDVKFSEWMRMDLEYIEKRSLLVDLKLIFKTAIIALKHKGSV